MLNGDLLLPVHKAYTYKVALLYVLRRSLKRVSGCFGADERPSDDSKKTTPCPDSGGDPEAFSADAFVALSRSAYCLSKSFKSISDSKDFFV